MRKLWMVPAAVLATALAVPAPARAGINHTTLGGVRVALREHTAQVVTVNHTRGYHARIGFWVIQDDRWRRIYQVRDGRIGYGGLVAPGKRIQGSGTTPLGTVTLISAFGRHPRGESWDLPYRRIRKGDFWVRDNESRYYNRYRNRSRGGFRWWLRPDNANSSERLLDYPVQYEYSVATSYNYAAQVRHRGAGIFLHVNGTGATGGCVSAPRGLLEQMMWRLDPTKVPVMAVGR